MNKFIGIIIIISVLFGALFVYQNVKGKSLTNSPSKEVNSKEKVNGYSGNVLAGTSSPYIEYNNLDYEKAINDGKVILLDFYASWCPICRAEEPEIFAGFNEINNENVVGFRVNFNDPDTDSDEKELAKKFGVPYQHTKIILKDGKEIARFSDQWTKQDLVNELNKVIK
jgi:thiol-disulfide isomerase/thioredoxin